MLDIFTIGDDVLRQQTVPVKEFDDALRLLVEARRDAAADCRLLPPLFLHASDRGNGPRWTPEALDFCPWLGKEGLGGGELPA